MLVRGARGTAAPSTYKASITVVEGFRIEGMLMIGGRDAAAKAEATGKAIISKVNKILAEQKINPIKRYNIELLGTEHCMSFRSKLSETRLLIV